MTKKCQSCGTVFEQLEDGEYDVAACIMCAEKFVLTPKDVRLTAAEIELVLAKHKSPEMGFRCLSCGHEYDVPASINDWPYCCPSCEATKAKLAEWVQGVEIDLDAMTMRAAR